MDEVNLSFAYGGTSRSAENKHEQSNADEREVSCCDADLERRRRRRRAGEDDAERRADRRRRRRAGEGVFGAISVGAIEGDFGAISAGAPSSSITRGATGASRAAWEP